MVDDGRFVWIKHTYEHSKLTEISTVQKFLTVQDNVYNRKNVYHLMLKSNVQKTHFAFFFLHDFIHTIFQAESTPPLHPPAYRIRSAK